MLKTITLVTTLTAAGALLPWTGALAERSGADRDADRSQGYTGSGAPSDAERNVVPGRGDEEYKKGGPGAGPTGPEDISGGTGSSPGPSGTGAGVPYQGQERYKQGSPGAGPGGAESLPGTPPGVSPSSNTGQNFPSREDERWKQGGPSSGPKSEQDFQGRGQGYQGTKDSQGDTTDRPSNTR